MFRRVFYENWHAMVPVTAFVLTFGVFLVASVRAMLTRKEQADRMAWLPLAEEGLEPAPVRVEEGTE